MTGREKAEGKWQPSSSIIAGILLDLSMLGNAGELAQGIFG